ncbi:hypothetical protein [Acinetobacter baumannii]|uniref:hypothetical protein n=1 Tax=Acinetobacter baumannii TaxID=470 RepID=UPI0023427367|nr:hypothetical protein [Acinetobacter baumannii]
MKPHVMSISDFAKYKGTSRQTVYNNLSELTTDNSYGTQRVVLDEKAENWKPKERYKPKSKNLAE